MCGIVGYVGPREATPILLEGLKKLEYRGYDSAGIALINGGDAIELRKKSGRLDNLRRHLVNDPARGACGISHTRWATHGPPTDENAHPHLDRSGRLALVHNGVIENYLKIRNRLETEGHEFASQTDSEVLAHLIGKIYDDLAEGTAQSIFGFLAESRVEPVLSEFLPVIEKDEARHVGLGIMHLPQRLARLDARQCQRIAMHTETIGDMFAATQLRMIPHYRALDLDPRELFRRADRLLHGLGQKLGNVFGIVAFLLSLHTQRQCDVFKGGQVIEKAEFLKDDADMPAHVEQLVLAQPPRIAAKHVDVPPRRLEGQKQQFKQGGFARPGRTGQKVKGTWGNLEGQVAQNLRPVAISQRHIVKFNQESVSAGPERGANQFAAPYQFAPAELRHWPTFGEC